MFGNKFEEYKLKEEMLMRKEKERLKNIQNIISSKRNISFIKTEKDIGNENSIKNMSQKILKLIKQYKIHIYFQLDEKKKDEIKCDLLCALKDVNKYLNEKSLLSEKNMNSFKLIIFELLLNIIDERFDATFVSESISLINNLFFLITKVKRTLLLKTLRIIDFTKILIHNYLQIHRKKKRMIV